MILWTVFNSPIGALGIALTDKGIGRVEFNASEPRFCTTVKKRFGKIAKKETTTLRPVIRQVKKYLGGKSVRFRARLDFGRATDFQKMVYAATLKIPYGQTKTYREIARSIGKPRAFRAVGQALGKNPIPIIVPCHRVVGSDGTLTGFGGGIPLKKRLLALEGVKSFTR